jgi:hypothetical protein
MAGQEAVRFWGRKWAESDCTKKTGKKSKKGSGNGVGSGTGLGSGFESESVSLSGLEAGQESDLGMALSPSVEDSQLITGSLSARAAGLRDRGNLRRILAYATLRNRVTCPILWWDQALGLATVARLNVSFC